MRSPSWSMAEQGFKPSSPESVSTEPGLGPSSWESHLHTQGG